MQPSHLARHISLHHSPPTRTKSTLDILNDSFHLSTPTPMEPDTLPAATSPWANTLNWLHTLTISLPPFWTTWYYRLSPNTKALVFHCLARLLQATLTASIPWTPLTSDTPPSSPAFLSSDSLWNWEVIFLFEALILAPHTHLSSIASLPRPTPKHPSPNLITYIVCTHLRPFEQGHLPKLFHQAYLPSAQPHHPPPTSTLEPALFTLTDLPDTHDPLFLSPQSFSIASQIKSAKKAFAVDNLSTAFHILTTQLPVGPLTPARMDLIKSTLFPPRCHLPSPPIPPPPIPPLPSDLFTSPSALFPALSKLKRGTVTGPFAYSTDLLRDFASFRSGQGTACHHPYLSIIRKAFLFIANGGLSASAAIIFSSQYFLAPHKDPSDLNKLCPIGVGSPWRCVIGALLTTHFSPQFAQHLRPYQFGIAIHSGMQFIIHTLTAQTQTLLPSSTNLLGDHVLLQIDITNMFNSISREHILSQLSSHFPTLIPYFQSMYDLPNTCYYCDKSNQWCSFTQPEGVTQGCSLSGMLACLGLHLVLQHCKQTLIAHTPINTPTQLAYMDDVLSVLPASTVTPYLPTFQHKGSCIGASLSPKKTMLLSTMDPTVPNSHPALMAALQHLSPESHLQQGTQVLGTPIGSPAFITTFIQESAVVFDRQVKCIMQGVKSLQVQFQIFRFCAQSTLPHLLATDFLLQFSARPPDLNTFDPFSFSSPLLDQINASTSAFLDHLAFLPASSPFVPSPPAWCICHLATHLNGRFRTYGLSRTCIDFFSHSAPPYNQDCNSRRHLHLNLRTPPPYPVAVFYISLLVHSILPHVPSGYTHCPIPTLLSPPSSIPRPFSSLQSTPILASELLTHHPERHRPPRQKKITIVTS